MPDHLYHVLTIYDRWNGPTIFTFQSDHDSPGHNNIYLARCDDPLDYGSRSFSVDGHPDWKIAEDMFDFTEAN